MKIDTRASCIPLATHLLGFVASVLLLGGCMKTPALSPAGESVKIIVKAEPDKACKELGDVDTGNDWLKNESLVKIMLRNQGGEKGANVVTLDVLKSDGNLVGGSGRAFKCP